MPTARHGFATWWQELRRYHSSPFEMAENCNSTGHCHRVNVNHREVLRACYIAQAHGLVRHAEFRVPGHMPPSENENAPIKYCQ